MFARDACWFLLTHLFRFSLLTALLGSQMFWPAVVQAQAIRAARSSSRDSLRQTVQKSGVIFDGTVTSVVRETGLRGAVLAYRIAFQVNQGIRGVRTGSVLTIREWAGLWTASDMHEPRYRVGERALVFFYPAGAGGLTSLVGGSEGKLQVDRAGMVVLPMEWMSHNRSYKVSNEASSVAGRAGSSRVPVRILAGQIRLAEVD